MQFNKGEWDGCKYNQERMSDERKSETRRNKKKTPTVCDD